MPSARVGHVGLYRDPHTLVPVEYYVKLPEDVADRLAILVDPMLATGGSAAQCVEQIKAKDQKKKQEPEDDDPWGQINAVGQDI